MQFQVSFRPEGSEQKMHWLTTRMLGTEHQIPRDHRKENQIANVYQNMLTGVVHAVVGQNLLKYLKIKRFAATRVWCRVFSSGTPRQHCEP